MNQNRIQRIDKIEAGSRYEGYVWMSNEQSPRVIEGAYGGISLLGSENPFIIEAQLYDAERMVSYSVKYVDGSYIATAYQVDSSDFNSTRVDQKVYFGHRMNNKKLHFLRYWNAVEDEFCEKQPVLQPAALVFVGFKTINSKEEEV